MKSHFENDRGLSLVEVLASLVILGIVFVGFMTVFPQMMLFNKKTEAKLQTMNIARHEITLIKNKEGGYSSPLTRDDILLAFEQTVDIYSTDESEGIIRINYERKNDQYEKSSYHYEADFFTEPIPGFESENHPENKVLYKIHLKVLVDGKQNSETYGYIEAKVSR